MAKANSPKLKRKRQTTNKAAKGKGHQKNQRIGMEVREKNVSSNNLLFSFTNVYLERVIMKSILIIVRIIICKCEKWFSKQGFRRSILPFNLLPTWGSLSIELN